MFGGTMTLAQHGSAHPSHPPEHPLAHRVLDLAAKGPVLGREPLLHTPGESKVPV